ncbi:MULTISPECIES: hypothetical protein [unclassified Exiguobacterium]|uniref:hypothetical protein n=1 Tax=unclassified Exiguobacterium TaxID=2644629 RepID=UPI001BE9B7DE|nr:MULTISPECIES: hypothetical protein [unclassified Exiguobacterium]
MIWINLAIIVLSLIGLGIYGYLLFKKQMKSEIGRLNRLTERFNIRADVIGQQVNEIKGHVDAVNRSITQIKDFGVKAKDESIELKQAAVGLTHEIKRTAGIERSDVSTETKI